ncbi:MAG: 7,8-dihydro-6-hydroxymethylpterin dimethyltransferase [Candidatus Woesearchaeota archaeon]|nr:7,8-dihydro-6-hydroxymethylpterin dimethyltransferase [Candidatus Woesearchaeota archaeon]
MEKRLDIKTGFLCNNNCRFCVQAWSKKHGNRPKNDIFKDMRAARKNKCTSIVLTGGEVSIREDFFELIKYAKKLGFTWIQAQTNGRRFAYMDFCKKAVKAGINDFGPALHGHNAKHHNYLTRAPGSFEQTSQGIKNMKKLGVNVVTNTVVVKPNYKYLPKIAKLLVELGVDQFQFAFMHAVGNAMDNYEDMMPRASKVAPYMKKGLQIGIDANKRVMAEAMPFCLLEGYEKYISDFYIPYTEIRDVTSYDLNFGKTRKEQGKRKFSQCKRCKYDLVCEGPWKEYPERKGNKEFIPVPGKKIRSKKEILC